MGRYSAEYNHIQLFIQQEGKVYEVVAKDGITLTREKNVASKLTCTILRNHTNSQQDLDFTPENGDIVKLLIDEVHHAFYGYIFETSKYDEFCTITAYDQLFYLARSKTAMSYKDITANQVVDRICRDTGMGMVDPPFLVDTQYKIPYRLEENVTYLDIIKNAIEATKENTGKCYYVWDDDGSIALTSDEWLATQVRTQISMGFIDSYSYVESVASDNFYTSMRVDKVVEATKKKKGSRDVWIRQNKAMREKFGFLQDYYRLQEGENGEHIANQRIAKITGPERTLHVEGAQGDVTMRGGSLVLVDFFTQDQKEYIRGWFTVDSITFTMEESRITSSIDLTLKEMGSFEHGPGEDDIYQVQYYWPDPEYIYTAGTGGP